jgi:hypothetical protein
MDYCINISCYSLLLLNSYVSWLTPIFLNISDLYSSPDVIEVITQGGCSGKDM